jgi:hypothetical protein
MLTTLFNRNAILLLRYSLTLKALLPTRAHQSTAMC